MSISKRVENILKQKGIPSTKSSAKGVEFAEKMKKAGLLDPYRQSSVDILELERNQLKLYRSSTNLL